VLDIAFDQIPNAAYFALGGVACVAIIFAPRAVLLMRGGQSVLRAWRGDEKSGDEESGPVTSPCAPRPPPAAVKDDCDGDEALPCVPDKYIWKSLDQLASGFPWPTLCFGRDMTLRVYNRLAEEYLGHPWNSVVTMPLAVMMDRHTAADFALDVDRYLDGVRDGLLPRWVGHRRKLTFITSDRRRMRFDVLLTDFGNGHGGIMMALAGAAFEEESTDH
jgi:hypothetical protein